MTKRQQDQLLRISAMEAVLQRAKPVLEDLERDLDRLEQLAPGLRALAQYYGSPAWRQDFADDEAGRLPEGLLRGVLSEDEVYDLLEALRALQRRMEELVQKEGDRQ